MKLVSLSCDRPSFKTLNFHPTGLTIILGDAASNNPDDGSSNGVGKTLALELIHHCLGANKNKSLGAAVPEWKFALTFELSGSIHRIERSGDSKFLALDSESIKLRHLQEWLNEHGPFRLAKDASHLSFRSLFARFARWHREDCVDPLQLNKEQPFDALLRTQYLLGGETALVRSKRANKLEMVHLLQAAHMWELDSHMSQIFTSGAQPRIRSEHLEREIQKLKQSLANFKVAEDYREVEIRAGVLTNQLRAIEKNQALVKFQLDGIHKALEWVPDIARSELMSLYAGLEDTFKPEVLKHFELVESFHHSLTANRQKRLENDAIELNVGRQKLERSWLDVANERDALIQSIAGKRALDEYAAVAQQLANIQEERKRIDSYLNFMGDVQAKIQSVRKQQVEEDVQASIYAQMLPFAQHDLFFAEMAGHLYPGFPAGIVLENNLGDNQVRYNLTVTIEGKDSDGINAARILCFDWLILTRGSNHSVDVLWHDNRLFAHMDPNPRKEWFKIVMAQSASAGKQYIASINTENFDAMKKHFSPEEWQNLKQSVAVTLRGDQASNKLLGLQFGG